jgi:hypothetical protein
MVPDRESVLLPRPGLLVCGFCVSVDLLSPGDRGTAVVLVAQTRQDTIKSMQRMQDIAWRGCHSHVPNAYNCGAIITDPRQGSQPMILAKMV